MRVSVTDAYTRCWDLVWSDWLWQVSPVPAATRIIEQGKGTMSEETGEIVEIHGFPAFRPPPMPVTWERSFFAVLRALRHLYFRLENAKLELHSSCELCDEIRNFLAVRNYRVDNIQNDDGWKTAFEVARGALLHLYPKVDAGGVEQHSATCEGCIETREFVSNSEYRGDLERGLEIDQYRPLNYTTLYSGDEGLKASQSRSAGVLAGFRECEVCAQVQPVVRYPNGDLVCTVCHLIFAD